jgi:hypothetical protein
MVAPAGSKPDFDARRRRFAPPAGGVLHGVPQSLEMRFARVNRRHNVHSGPQVSLAATDARTVGIVPAARQKPGAKHQDPKKGTKHHGYQ